MQGRNEDLTMWHDFHARQYDAALGRWFGVDPQNQFVSPYLAMGNNPVMMVDPDGEFVIEALIIGLGAGIGAFTSHNRAKNQGYEGWQLASRTIAGGIIGAFGGAKLTTGIAALKAGKSLKAAAVATNGLKAKKLSNIYAGTLNMINNHDPEKGFDLHSLGYFGAGYFGSEVGIMEDALSGYFAGGIGNFTVDLLNGKIHNFYSVAQSLVGGVLAAEAGRSFNTSITKKLKIASLAERESPHLFDKFTKYGLLNVASNFAYDKKQEFFKKPLAMHFAGFMVGGIGAGLQEGIMGKFYEESLLGPFGQRFVNSSLAYFAEYSSNYYYKTKMQQIRYGDYRRSKAASYGVKSFAYSWLYSF